MNRWTTQGLIAGAASGAEVLVISPTHARARDLLDQTMRAAGETDAIARHTSGNESIRFPSGGRIRFQAARASIRGMSPSTVVLDDVALDADTLSALRATCPNGHFVQA